MKGPEIHVLSNLDGPDRVIDATKEALDRAMGRTK